MQRIHERGWLKLIVFPKTLLTKPKVTVHLFVCATTSSLSQLAAHPEAGDGSPWLWCSENVQLSSATPTFHGRFRCCGCANFSTPSNEGCTTCRSTASSRRLDVTCACSISSVLLSVSTASSAGPLCALSDGRWCGYCCDLLWFRVVSECHSEA